jgi:hypothetical protein
MFCAPAGIIYRVSVKVQKGFASPNPIGVNTNLKYNLPHIVIIPLLLDPNNLILFASISTVRQELKNNRSLIYISNFGEFEIAY